MFRPDEEKRRFTFRNGESFNGAVARWCEARWAERMIDIIHTAGVRGSKKQNASTASDEGIRALAEEMRVNAGELISRASQHVDGQHDGHAQRIFYGLQLPARMIEGQVRRYSPAAFALPGGDYHRALWDLRLLPVCTETGQPLLDRCQGPRCDGRRVGWIKTMGVTTCEHCMVSLAASSIAPIPPELLAEIQPVAGLFVPERRQASLDMLPAEIALDGGQLAVDLLIRLLRVVDPGMAEYPFTRDGIDPERACRALVGSWEIMTGWPDAFHTLMLDRLLERTKRHDDGNQSETRRFLKVAVDGSRSPELTQLAASIRDTIDLAGPNGAALAASTYQTKAAAGILGIGTAEITSLRRGGAFRSVVVLEVDRLQPRFDRAEVDELRRGIDSRMGCDFISSRFGIAHHGVEQLADMGMIDVLQHHFFVARYGVLQSTKASVADLVRQLVSGRERTPAGASIRLRDAMKAVGQRHKPWGPAIRLLLDGDLPYWIVPGPDPIADRIRIGVNDVSRIPDLVFRPRTEPLFDFSTMMSKQDAADLLNCGPHAIMAIFAHIPTAKGSRSKSVPVDEVLDVAGRCIFPTELAARRGVQSQTAYADALRVKLPLFGHGAFHREPVEAMLASGAVWPAR